MAYQALYRSWRPQNFRGLIGQDHIRVILENALSQGKIGHAYLFSGPRGTGKTSTAKIFAKAVNCDDLKDGQPCGRCESCLAIGGGYSMDVLEIDAASNRGIEEIRDLKEKINFIPAHGKYKVYIIDEVHMLTMEAFNALLKTLEEPPAHVIFMLATTEAHKLPATVLSRCQRFDFRKISLPVIEGYLREMALSLNLDLEPGAAALIAKKAEGSLRDAISLLDQCIGRDQAVLTAETVYQILGMVRQEALGGLVQAMIENDGGALLTRLDALMTEGIEPMQILKDMMECLRNLMMIKICGDQTALVALADADRDQMLAQARNISLLSLQSMIGRLSKAEADGRWRGNVRFMLEALLVELTIGLHAPVAPAAPAAPAVSVAPAAPAATAPTAPAPTAPASKPSPPDGGRLFPEWPQVLEQVRERKKTLHAFLMAIVDAEYEDDLLNLTFKEGHTFHKEQTELPDNQRLIEDVLNQVLGRPVQIRIRMRKEKNMETAVDPVKKALEIFGPDIVTIKKE
jgi:DNA polymerase-3 subunit gamma/tau